jgi:lysophospholipase L1-like esterase
MVIRLIGETGLLVGRIAFWGCTVAPTNAIGGTTIVRKRPLRHLSIIGISFGIVALILALTPLQRAHAATPHLIGPKSYYLGLGDSLAFGFQPNLDWSHGYVQDYYNNDLKNKGVAHLVNYGCNGEKSTTMINGGCPYQIALHNYYLGDQLDAAVFFLATHPGQVSPVTLDMGANDLLPDIDSKTCTVNANWTNDLATLNSNLVNTILPRLVGALTNGSGQRTGDLIMTNYYDPYASKCPNSLPYVQQLNAAIAADAAQFGIPVADTYSAFGGNNMGSTICNNTWICSIFGDIHPKSAGYTIIANTISAKAGY